MPYKKSDTNPFGCGRSVLASAACAPGDEQQGGWPRERLVAMNERFVARVERAFKNGTEHRQSAAMKSTRNGALSKSLKNFAR